MADATILVLGGLALLLMGGKKKKPAIVEEEKREPGKEDPGGILDVPGEKGKPSTPGAGRGTRAPSNLADDAIWVRKDCKEVAFGDGTGELWWERKGKPAAEKFIAANYFDPYEIARSMILTIAPCAVEFPVLEDGLNPMDEEFAREMFLREFPDVYYLIMFLYNRISELLDQEDYTIEFNEDCDVTFVGEKWMIPIARRMANFYLTYGYPLETPVDWVYLPVWEGAEVPEKNLVWWDNIVIAIINRMAPNCAKEIAAAFKKEPFAATSYFSKRPGLFSLYLDLQTYINELDDERFVGGLEFNPDWNPQS